MDHSDVISIKSTDQSEPETDGHMGNTGREWETFTSEFLDLLHPRSSTGLSVCAFVRRCLAQFHLQYLFSEAYILNEVYMRAHRMIVSKGGTVQHVPAWVRSTAYNVVRELRRERSHVPIDEETMGDSCYSPLEAEETLEHDLLLMGTALNQLNPEDRRLIELKVIHDLSWHEISIILVQEGIQLELGTLRKRKERAIARLRQIYHSLNPT